MEPRNRAKRTGEETGTKRGFKGKGPSEEPVMAQRQALAMAKRQEDAIFQELLGKELFISLHGLNETLIARLELAGTNFVKLTNVREIFGSNPDNGEEYREFVKKMNSPIEPDEHGYSEPLFSHTTPTLILSKSKIEKMAPLSDYE